MRYLAAVCLFLALMSSSRATTWTLPGIDGHMPNEWQPGRNWNALNPLDDKAAQWSLRFKDGSGFKLMERGLAYKYNFVWREKGDGLEPHTFYLGQTLMAARFKGQGAGPESAVVFAPGNPGTYRGFHPGNGFCPASGTGRRACGDAGGRCELNGKLKDARSGGPQKGRGFCLGCAGGPEGGRGRGLDVERHKYWE